MQKYGKQHMCCGTINYPDVRFWSSKIVTKCETCGNPESAVPEKTMTKLPHGSHPSKKMWIMVCR